MNSLQGHLLVAVPHQLDPNFVETVILVVAHTNRGAMGVILNRPKPQRRQPLWQRRTRRQPGKPALYFGGPVTGPLMAVHTDPSHSEMRIMPGVFFSGKKENVLAALRNKRQLCKLFLGYVGWGPRQLEYEVQIGVCASSPARSERYFPAATTSGTSFTPRPAGSSSRRCSTSTMSRLTRR